MSSSAETGSRSDGAPILVLNAGSSSLKAALIDNGGTALWRQQWPWQGNAARDQEGSPETLLQSWLPALLEQQAAVPRLVGHRVVHGGSRFIAPTRLDASVLEELQALIPLAPLHNGPALRVMAWMAERWPGLSQWACFDTAFHHTLSEAEFSYALPADWRALGLRRYGFHGLNHQHISEVVRQGAPEGEAPLRLISCHLGAGCSLCAIQDGNSVATTMGFTPLEGLVMANRCGDVDAGVLLELLRRGVSPAELERRLNGASGLLGLSGLSGDMQELRQAAAAGHHGAALAIAVFERRLLQGIGSMAASLGGVDVIALSGGIGEHDTDLRETLRRGLRWLEPFQLRIVAADEEGVIARACREGDQGNQAQPRTGSRLPC